MTRILGHFLVFILFLLLQVLLFNNFTIAGLATPFANIVFLLMLPLSIRLPLAMLIGFASGLMLDLFSHDYMNGLHSFCSVLIMATRIPWIKIISTRNAIKGNEDSFVTSQPLIWYFYYLSAPILVYNFCYFFLEAFGFSGFGMTLLKTFLSSIFTYLVCIGLAMLFYIRPEKR